MISFNIEVNGKPITEYLHEGKVYVEGRMNTEYIISLKSSENSKIKAVVSVDGVNVLTGDATWEAGYTLDRHSSVKIPGWRVNSDKVAKFLFGSKSKSYAGEYGDVDNCGVIGIRLFHELKGPAVAHWNVNALSVNHNGMLRNAPIVASAAPSSMGTGWGDGKTFVTSEDYTKFSTQYFQQSTIYYDDANGLKKRGIVLKRQPSEPNPFPNDFGCRPPKSVR